MLILIKKEEFIRKLQHVHGVLEPQGISVNDIHQ